MRTVENGHVKYVIVLYLIAGNLRVYSDHICSVQRACRLMSKMKAKKGRGSQRLVLEKIF